MIDAAQSSEAVAIGSAAHEAIAAGGWGMALLSVLRRWARARTRQTETRAALHGNLTASTLMDAGRKLAELEDVEKQAAEVIGRYLTVYHNRPDHVSEFFPGQVARLSRSLAGRAEELAGDHSPRMMNRLVAGAHGTGSVLSILMNYDARFGDGTLGESGTVELMDLLAEFRAAMGLVS